MSIYKKYLKCKRKPVNEFFGMRATSSLVNPPESTARSAASVAGDDDDIRHRVEKIADMIKSGDVAGAADSAAKYFLRYGKPFAYALADIKTGSEFDSMYTKAKEALKSNDKPKEKK